MVPELIALALGLLIGLGLIAVVEMFVLKALGLAERPKNILYPILANALSFIVALLVFGLIVALFAAGLFIAMDSGYNDAEWLLNTAYAAPFLIPVVMFAIRFFTFLLMKLGDLVPALLYSVASTAGTLIAAGVVTGGIWVVLSIAGIV